MAERRTPTERVLTMAAELRHMASGQTGLGAEYIRGMAAELEAAATGLRALTRTAEPPPDAHTFTVTVWGCTAEQAAQVIGERVHFDEDYGFPYRIALTGGA